MGGKETEGATVMATMAVTTATAVNRRVMTA
jgi:hypothetical protein